MNNEKYNQIVDEAYEKYINSLFYNFSGEVKGYLTHFHLTRVEFIFKCKTDSEFSEKRGLKIKERKLSLGERGEIFRKEYPNKSVDDFAPGGMEVQSLNHQLNTRYNNANIPTKLLTIIYNNETIEVYV